MRRVAEAVVRAGAPKGALATRRVAFMRYHGQGHEIEVALPDHDLGAADIPALQLSFEREYARQFSRAVPDMTIEILNWGVSVASPSLPPEALPKNTAWRQLAAPQTRQIICDLTGQTVTAGFFERAKLRSGDQITGPALITEPQTTTLVSADFTAEVDPHGNVWLTRMEEPFA